MKKHQLALILAVAVGAIYASHHFFIPNFFPDKSGGIYQPITPNEYYDESLFYAPKAAAVFWGSEFEGVAGPLNRFILGYVMKIFGSVKAGLIASDFIFPAAIFLLIYLLMFEIISSPFPSAVFALIFVFAPKLFMLNEMWPAVAPFSRPTVLHFSEFDEPKITFIFMALFGYLLMRVMMRGGKASIVFAGISFGLLFYTYPYDWAMGVTILVLMAIIFAIQGHFYVTRRVGMIFVIGIATSVFYWMNWLELSKTAPDVIARLGGEVGRFFRWETVWKHYLRIVILIPLLWHALRGINRRAWVFIAAYLVAFVVAVNIQVITGFNAQPDHWYRTQFLPVSLAIFLIAYYFYASYIEKYFNKKIIFGLLVFWFLTANIYGQYLYSAKYAGAFYIQPEKYESYEWLKNNTLEDSVIGTLSFETSPVIQLFSHNKVFLPFGLSTLASNDELWERLRILAKIFGITPEEFKNLILKENGLYYLTVEQYGDKSFDAVFRDYDRAIHPDELSDRAVEYMFYLRADDSHKYRLDYLYYDKKDSRWGKDPLKRLDNLEKVFENNAAIIYEIR